MFESININGGALLQLSIYLIIFLIILGLITSYNKADEILANWSEYRFKPYILPISGFIKKIDGKSRIESTLDNFSEFLWSTFRNFFNILIKPIQFMFSIIKSLLGDLEKMTDKFRGQLTVMRNLILGIIMNMMKRVENIMAATIFTFGKVNDMVKRQLGIYQNLVYLLQTMTITMRSFVSGTFDHMMNFTEGAMWALPIFTLGAPGVVFPLMAFCFAEGTPIRGLKNSINIENIKIGDILLDGSRVISKMKYYHKGPIFKYNGVFVTGEHYVMLNNNWQKIKNINGIQQHQYEGYLYNINTTNNRINIGNDIYLDYDEYSTIDLAENENNLVLNKLNSNTNTIKSNNLIENDRRYKLGFTENTKILNKSIEVISLGSVLDDGSVVLGIVSHLIDKNDRIYRLGNVEMTEWVKVYYEDHWINVRDHPNAKLINYGGNYLFSIITSSNTVNFGEENLITRDFIEIL